MLHGAWKLPGRALNPFLLWQLKDRSLLIQAGFIDNVHVKTTASGKRFPVYGKGGSRAKNKKTRSIQEMGCQKV